MWDMYFDYVGPEWYGMWSARPLLILEQCAFDSLKSPIPVNVEHWDPAIPRVYL